MIKLEMQVTFKNGKERWFEYAISDFREFHEMVDTMVEMLFDTNPNLDYVGFFENGELYRQWYEGEEIFDEDGEEDY